ncbi:hypothetical protein M9Y10_007980 [Tritrichomonas musculus]|uniref:Uncharacterized protein n=1 Tax=Tritrichomonas musculus TaxID=1915356 RepID=A0ABR2J4I8_9EUKA
MSNYYSTPQRVLSNGSEIDRTRISVDGYRRQNDFGALDQTVIKQEIAEYINQKKEFYDNLIIFLENVDENEENILDIIKTNHYENDREKLVEILQLIASIANNHHRNEHFFKKIFIIIRNLKDQIWKTFLNSEIYDIFESNKIILLFLFENKILTFDNNINKKISIIEANDNHYRHFFYPEIKGFNGEQQTEVIKNELLSINSNIFDRFEEKRHEGENDSHICSLIRQDMIEEFISYVTRTNYPLNSIVEPSIFETNSFLIEQKNTTLIEYSAFFGSIQIFQYLKLNGVELKRSLWRYSIHSQNAELIHLLESSGVKPPHKRSKKKKHSKNKYKYKNCFIESIKCHHNSIASYFEDNFFEQDSNIRKKERVLSRILLYHNYSFLPSKFHLNDSFYLYEYGYSELFKLVMVMNKIRLRKRLLSNDGDASNMNSSYREEQKRSDICKSIYCDFALRQRIEFADVFFSEDDHKKIKKIVIYPAMGIFGNSMFYDDSLTHLTFSRSICSINNLAFDKFSNLVHVNIPPSIESIGKFAFNCCRKLKKIKITSSQITIGSNAFFKCSALKELTILSSQVTIGDNAFAWCYSLKELLINSSELTIGENAFESCAFDEIIFSADKSDTSQSSKISISKMAFNRCRSLKRIKFPPSAISIEESAFDYCSSLSQITVSSTFDSLADVPTSLSPLIIGHHAFAGLNSLTEVTIPFSTTHIGCNCFESCCSLKKVTIPNSVKNIGFYAFYKCSSLDEITLPLSVTEIGHHAFSKCTSLRQIAIPSSVSSIKEGTFEKCSALKEITIPSSVTSIEDCAFIGCSSLKEISIPSSVTRIGDKAFMSGIKFI